MYIMKKLTYLFLIVILTFSCSNETLELNEFDLVPKKLIYIDNTIYEDSINFNEFGNRILIVPETVLQKGYFYNDSQQLIAYGNGAGPDYYESFYFNYGLGASANKVVSIEATVRFNVNRVDNRVLIEVDNGTLPSSHITELIFNSNNSRLLEQLTYNASGSNPWKINFFYDSNNNPILIKSSRYNETSGNYELFNTVEQTFDDKNNFLKNTGQQDIITSYFLRWYALTFIDPISGSNSDLSLLMNPFATNNLLTQTKTNNSIGLLIASNYVYLYNEFEYPISGTRTTINMNGEEFTRNYLFEYY